MLMRYLLRVITMLAVALGVISLSMAPVQALTNFNNAPSGAHYASGSSEPVCTFNASTATLSCTGTQIAGVGNTNATLMASVASSFTGVCHNPGNANVVEPFTDSSSASITTPLFPSKNGRLVVPSVTVNGTSTSEFLATFSCPNPNWTAEVTNATITWSYSVTFAGFSAPVISLHS
jgi:hypothetical protein